MAKGTAKNLAKIKVTQVKSGIDRPARHKRILKALGLRRHQTSRVHEASATVLGMVHHVRHLVKVEEVKSK